MENVTGSIKISDHLTVIPTRVFTGDTARVLYETILHEHVFPKRPYADDNLLVCGIWKEDGRWAAMDNRSGDCWIEIFKTRAAALKWIFNGE